MEPTTFQVTFLLGLRISNLIKKGGGVDSRFVEQSHSELGDDNKTTTNWCISIFRS